MKISKMSTSLIRAKGLIAYLCSEKPVTQLERALNKLLRNACLSGDLASNDTLREPHEGHIVVVEDLETLCPASARRADRTSAADPDALRVFSLLERLFACIERYPSCRMLVIGTVLSLTYSLDIFILICHSRLKYIYMNLFQSFNKRRFVIQE